MARCALKPSSFVRRAQGKLSIPVRREVADRPPLICTQQSLTVPTEQGAKFLQALQYQSPEWHAVYSTLRNCVEGANGNVKDGAHEALDDPERRRIQGVAAQSASWPSCLPPPTYGTTSRS